MFFTEGNGNWACPRCGKLGFPNEQAARNCACNSGYSHGFGTGLKKCPTCSGTGHMFYSSSVPCNACGGSGKVPY